MLMAEKVLLRHTDCPDNDWLFMVVAILLVSITSSVEVVQGLLETVQVKVAFVPAVIPVTPELYKEGDVTVAVPPVTLHAPVPTPLLPANVKLLLLQFV